MRRQVDDQAVRGVTLARLRALVALSLFALGVASAPAHGRENPSRSGGAAPAAVKADRDGDGVFEDLESRVRGLGRDARVPVIVTLAQPATSARVAEVERAVGGFALKDRFRIIDAFAATVGKGQIRALAQRPGVVSVEHDSRVRAFNDGAQASFGVTEARLDAPSLDGDGDGNPTSYSSADLVAAVLDSGIDAGHSDLDGGKVLAFKDFIGTRTTPYDDDGHGTHAAATIAGDGDGRLDRAYRGVAPAAGLVGVKVLDSNGDGAMSGVTAAIDWVVANRAIYGIEAINLSLGVAGCSDGSDATSAAVNNAHDAGLVVAVAAGNEGPGTCTIGAPGAAAKALTVGAMADTSAGGFFQAFFSSRGKTADGRIKPDVSAPGVNITSAAANTVNGYVSESGTSMATPFVAGVALLMRDASSALTSQQVNDKIRQTAVDWGRGGDNRTSGSRGADIDYGAGRLDAYAALASAGAALSSPPPAPDHRVPEGSLSGTGAVANFQISVTSTAFPVAATMIMADVTDGALTSPDFDLILLDPAGTPVAGSAFATRQEELTFAPTVTGTYTVRVVSRAGGGSFFVDISAGMAPDTSPPETTIDSGPSGTVTSASATFSFSSNEAGSAFECRVDGSAWQPCTSPRSYSGLSDGAHTFDVRARDAAGNFDPSAASRTWAVDTTPPDTTITSGPSGTVNSSDASFTFASEAGANFECRLDGSAWAGCTSPTTYAGLSDGARTFEVRAADGAGNVDPSPASRSWTVATAPPPPLADTTPPEASLRVPRQRLRRVVRRGLKVAFSSSEPGRANVTVRISRRTARNLGLGGRKALTIGRIAVTLDEAGQRRVRVKLSRKARRALRRARSVRMKVRLRATDAAGNRHTVVRRIRLRR